MTSEMVKMTTDVGLQSPNAQSTRLIGDVKDAALAERAQRATKLFRQMQPMLTGFAKAITKRADVRVVLAPGTPCTDGKVIYMRPPVELGEVKRHQRHLCDKREDGLLICEACSAREEIMVILYHEIAHIAFGTFEEIPDWEKKDAIQRALAERGISPEDVRAVQIKRNIENAPYHAKSNYLGLSNLISPYLPVLINALEDARVNRQMYNARPGVQTMFENWAKRLIHEGRKEFDGTVHKWADAPRNIQVVIGLFAKASGYDYHTEGWFSDEVIAALDDAKLTGLLWKLEHQVRSASGVYNLAFPVLERLRELGFCRQPEEEDEPEPQPEGKSEDKSDDPGEEGESEEGLSGSEGTPQDTEGDDDDESNTGSKAGSGGEDNSESDQPSGDSPEDDGSEDGHDESEAGSSSSDGDSDQRDGESGPGESEGDEEEGSSEGEGAPSSGSGPVDDDTSTDGESSSEDDEDGEGDAGGLTGTGDISDPTMPEDEPAEPHQGNGAPGPGGADTGEDDDSDGDADGSAEGSGDGDEGDDDSEPWEAPVQDQPTKVLSDPERDGTAEQVNEALKEFGGHAEPKETYAQAKKRQEKENELDRAIVQAAWFEAPSSNIFGIRLHRFDSHALDPVTGADLSHGWTRQRGLRDGVRMDGEVDETLLGPSLLRMRHAFHENKRADKQKNLKSGRVDARVLGRRAAVEDPRLFARRRVPGKRDYFVCIGIDVSASTTGRNLLLAKTAAFAQAELLARAGISFAMYAHSGYPDSHGLSVDIYVLKEEQEPWDPKTQERLTQLGAVSSNLDGHTMEFYRKVCDQSRATDKIIMYYTDGKMPAENYDEELEILTREIRTCRQRGYTLMGVGIRTDSPIEHGLDTVQIDEIEDLGKVVNHLAKRLSVLRSHHSRR